ncbi:MAG: hypothetical protein Greene041662_1038, partial [Candidatus Peregrinibacteria bacterium Greene0416_62]
QGMSIRLRDAEGIPLIGEYVSFSPRLEPGALYDLTVEDHGTMARLVIAREGKVIGEIEGAVSLAPKDGHIVMRKGGAASLQLQTPSITVTHGHEAVQHAAPKWESNALSPKAVDTVFSDPHAVAALLNAEAVVQPITKDDPRLRNLTSTDYGSLALASTERSRLFGDSRFAISTDQQNTIATRHPEYGRGNGGVDSDIRTDLGNLLGAYQDVVGDALMRGMEVQLAELKGESLQKPMEMLDFVLGTRASGRSIGELARWFKVSMPSKNEILEESRLMLTKNIDRLIANQEVVAAQNWKDTHGATPQAPIVSRALELNMGRGLKDAMILTAQKIGSYSSDVRQEFETAVTYAGLNLGEVYAEASLSSEALAKAEVPTLYASATPIHTEVLASSGVLRQLEIPGGLKIDTEALSIPAEGSETLRFTLDREVMANFWVNSVAGRALSLSISGGSLPTGGYSSDHGLSSADSTSLRLTPGTYDVTVSDKTNYGIMPNGNDMRSRPLEFPLHMDVQPWNTRQIMGRVSLPGEREAKEVSLRVAEFDDVTGKRIKSYDPNNADAVKALDPSKPVWVVVHGREDNEGSGKMEQLARELTASGYQVLTMNWSDGAKDNAPHFGGLQGEQWIEPTATKIFEMLHALGVRGENISFGVHSWGSFVSYEIAERYKEENGFGVQAIVALDPAKDPTLGIGYDAAQVDFSKVSNVSWGFHSSMWGSVPRAMTGGKAIEIRSPDVLSPTDKHGLAVTAFANLIRLQREDPQNELTNEFRMSSLSESQNRVQCDDIYEGWMWVTSYDKTDKNGAHYVDAVPSIFTATNPDNDIPDVYRDSFFSNSVQ